MKTYSVYTRFIDWQNKLEDSKELSFNELYSMIEDGYIIIKDGVNIGKVNKHYEKSKMNKLYMIHRVYKEFLKDYNEFIGA